MLDRLNAIDKRYIYQLISSFQIPGSKRFSYHMQMHTSTQNNDLSLAKEFQQHLSKEHRKNGDIYQVNTKQEPVKENVYTESIKFRIILTLYTNM